MRSEHLPLIRVAGVSSISFEGTQDGDELLNGSLLAAGQPVAHVRDGVASFIDRDPWASETLEQYGRDRFTTARFRQPQFLADPRHEPLMQALLAAEEPILEVAIGFGGGNLPLILRRRPKAQVIVNDLSAGVLHLWRVALREEQTGDRVSFVAFNATSAPLRDESVGVISSVAGLSNIHDGEQALRECLRVLRPGGVLCAAEIVYSVDSLEQLPAEVTDEWRKYSAVSVKGIVALVERELMDIESSRREYWRKANTEQDGVAEVALRHGVELDFEMEWVVARKRSG